MFTLERLVPWKAWSPILVTLEGIVTLVRRDDSLNASPPMLVTPLGTVNVAICEFRKTPYGIAVADAFHVADVRVELSAKAQSPTEVIVLGRTTFVSEAPWKAAFAMLEALASIVTAPAQVLPLRTTPASTR